MTQPSLELSGGLPVPMKPTVMRLLGAVWPSAPRTEEGTICGATAARHAVVAALRMKLRREIRRVVFIIDRVVVWDLAAASFQGVDTSEVFMAWRIVSLSLR
jgi:hypothetical protein